MATEPQKMQCRAKRLPLSASNDNEMMAQLVAVHAPVEGRIDVRPLLHVVQDIFHRVASAIPPIVQGKQVQWEALDEHGLQSPTPQMLHNWSHKISRISCEIWFKCCWGGGDAHETTMGILGMLSSHSWESKVVIALAALALKLGEFWLVTLLYASNPLATWIAILKHIPQFLKRHHIVGLTHRYDAITHLLGAMLDLADCIVELHELPSQYIQSDTPPMSSATARIPIAVYWTIRSILASAFQISAFLTIDSPSHMASATETWELSCLAHKLNSIHSHIRKQLILCHKHIDDKRQDEAFQTLVRLLETSHDGNLEVLRGLIRCDDDDLPLLDGSTNQRVSIDVLGSKIVLLFISDLDLSDQELLILGEMYQESRQIPDMFPIQYEVVWLPVLNRTTPWTEVKRKKLEELQSKMPWYSVYDPSLMEQAVIRYIKEVWRYKKKPILVVLDQQGKVVNLNALHIMWIWGSLAYPFTVAMEESIWKQQTWGLELLADIFHPFLLTWIPEGKYICLYGGEDLEWIRKFTRSAYAMANTLQVPLEMIYMGKSNPGEKVERIKEAILSENLSHTMEDLMLIWYFWVRIESMWHSKLHQGNTLDSDPIMQEIMTILSYDASDEGWAVISGGTERMVKARGEIFLKCLNEYEQWKGRAKEKGLLNAMNDYVKELQTPHHCNRLIVPGSNGRTLDEVVCAECGRPMAKFFMYRCCTDQALI